MAHFTGAGVIANDIVRKETRRGILATFRLASGQAGKGQVWIDVEAWGNLAGTIHHHGSEGRGVIVGGRLTQKTWRDRANGASRHRYVITANDIDLLPGDLETTNGIDCPNHVTIAGTVDSAPTTRQAGTGTVTEFTLASGRAGTKTGRLWIPVQLWQPEQPTALADREFIVITGRLAYRVPSDGADGSGIHIRARGAAALRPPRPDSSVRRRPYPEVAGELSRAPTPP